MAACGSARLTPWLPAQAAVAAGSRLTRGHLHLASIEPAGLAADPVAKLAKQHLRQRHGAGLAGAARAAAVRAPGPHAPLLGARVPLTRCWARVCLCPAPCRTKQCLSLNSRLGAMPMLRRTGHQAIPSAGHRAGRAVALAVSWRRPRPSCQGLHCRMVAQQCTARCSPGRIHLRAACRESCMVRVQRQRCQARLPSAAARRAASSRRSRPAPCPGRCQAGSPCPAARRAHLGSVAQGDQHRGLGDGGGQDGPGEAQLHGVVGARGAVEPAHGWHACITAARLGRPRLRQRTSGPGPGLPHPCR